MLEHRPDNTIFVSVGLQNENMCFRTDQMDDKSTRLSHPALAESETSLHVEAKWSNISLLGGTELVCGKGGT